MKHIVAFSGGASSAKVAQLVIEEYGHEDVVLLFHDTKAEHPDSYRFRQEVGKFLNHPVEEVSDGRTLWELIIDNHSFPSPFIPFCTRILKHEQRDKYLKQVGEYKLYLGFDVQEWRRAQKSIAIDPHGVFPLLEKGITGDQAKEEIMKKWRICLPASYRHLKHNNCLPCFKGGKAHFLKILQHYPHLYKRCETLEDMLRAQVFKDVSLRDLRQADESQIKMFEEESEKSCMCAA